MAGDQSIQIDRQRGVALIIGLILMVLISILAISSLQNTLLEERMAGNLRNQNMAFQAAESGLVAGELRVQELIQADLGFECSSSDGCYHEIDNPWNGLTDSTWTWIDANTGSYVLEGGMTAITGVNEQPQYVIEIIRPNILKIDPTKPPKQRFRVAARGVGATANVTAIHQSTYMPLN